MNQSSQNSIIFIDQEVLDSERKNLIDDRSFANALAVVAIHREQPALAQIAVALEEHQTADGQKLDSLHIISHGRAGELQLGGERINSDNLSDYSSELATIGSYLTEEGDIHLYACDLAQGSEGQAFIDNIATITGAEIAASFDLTGNPAQGGNWVLESHTGSIESAAISIPALQTTLYSSGSQHFNINKDNQSLWWDGRGAIDIDIDNFVFNVFDSKHWSGETKFKKLGTSIGIDYDIKIEDLKVGIPIKASISAGDFDLNYPVDVDIALPGSVKAGDEFNIATGFHYTAMPTLNIDAPKFDASIKLGMWGGASGHLGLEASAPGINIAKALIGETKDGGVTYTDKKYDWTHEKTLLGISASKNEITYTNASFEEVTRPIVGKKLGEASDGSADDDSAENTSDGALFKSPYFAINADLNLLEFEQNVNIKPDNGSAGLYDIECIATKKAPLLEFTADVDDILGGLLSATPIGPVLSGLDIEYQAEFKKWFIDVEASFKATLLSLNASVGLTPALKVFVDAQNIAVEAIASTGETKHGNLGDTFTFSASDTDMTVDFNYTLQGNLKTELGFYIDGGFDVQALGFSGSFNNYSIGTTFKNQDGEDSNYLFETSKRWKLGEFFPDAFSFNHDFSYDFGKTTHKVNFGDYTLTPTLSQPDLPSTFNVRVDGLTKDALGVAEIEEGNAGDSKAVTFIIERSGNLEDSITVNYYYEFGQNVDAEDFTNGLPADGSITFAAGESYKTITTYIKGDDEAEADEKFLLRISPESGLTRNQSAAVSIYSDDGLLISGEGFIRGTGRDDVIKGSDKADTITAGAGDDTIYLNGSDTVYAGSGNDTIFSTGGGNKIYGDASNDTLNIAGRITGNDTYDGGAGEDTLNIDWSKVPSYREISLSVQSGEEWQYFGSRGYGKAISEDIATIEKALSAGESLRYKVYGENSQITFKNVEVVNISGGGDDDFLAYHNGTEYHGNGGTDTFYADWSDWKEAVVWTNNKDDSKTTDKDESLSVIGKEHKVNVSGMERLLLKTGSGDDILDNSAFGRGDEYQTGKGNDTISTGSGNDRVWSGNGDDTLNIAGRITGNDTYDGGAGEDTLNIDWSKVPSFREISLSVQSGEEWQHFGSRGYGKAISEDIATIEKTLSAGESLRYKVYGENSQITFKNVEVVNISGGGSHDFLAYHNGTEYHGNGGTDTFYADWSDWKEAVVWTNNKDDSKTTDKDESLSVIGKEHKVNVSGMERLLLKTGSGDDIIDNSANNQRDEIHTGAGNDRIITGAGDDTINGGDGDDYLNGGSGADTMTGGAGNDIYYIDNASDKVIEEKDGGHDIVFTTIKGYTADNVEEIIYLGEAAEQANNFILGEKGENNTLGGGEGNDIIYSFDGIDLLDGVSGNNTLYGGKGSDTYIVRSTGDKAIEKAGEGIDSVISHIDYTLGEHLEMLTLEEGSEARNGKGNSQDNRLNGNSADNHLEGLDGNDLLYGGDGDDKLDGGEGNDQLNGNSGTNTLIGGNGNDAYTLNSDSDRIVELGVNDIDTVQANFEDYTLGDGLEILILDYDIKRGTGNATHNLILGSDEDNILDGREGDDILYGLYGDDYLIGGDGRDTLNGGEGSDILEGGKGDDEYYVDRFDTIIEEANGGIDTVYTEESYELGAHVEDLILEGYKAIDGIGNEVDNTISGNWNDNHLKGGGGNDILEGYEGNDTLEGGEGDDQLTGGEGADTFLFGEGALDSVDTIEDFNPKEDMIALAKRVFSQLGDGGFDLDGGMGLHYERSNGELSYEVGGQSIHFATIAGGHTADLRIEHFYIV